jgi:hypothetical protein
MIMVVASILTALTLCLTLLCLATSFVCFLVGRPRIAMFFFFLALDFFRRFAFFLSQLASITPTASYSYNALSSDWGYVVIWGGALLCLAWSWWDFWHNLGGIRGARAYTRKLRAQRKIVKAQIEKEVGGGDYPL